MSSQTTDIISLILSFLNLGLTIAAVIIAYYSLKALAQNVTNTSSILPMHSIPRRTYHPYTTGYVHYLRDPYLRPVLEAAYRPQRRMLRVEGGEGLARTMEMEVAVQRQIHVGNMSEGMENFGEDET